MKMENLKSYLMRIAVAGGVLAIALGVNYLYAWTSPASNPPNGNVSAPLNVSSTDQVKSGGLGVGTFTAGNTAITGTLGVGVVSPSQKFAVIGGNGLIQGSSWSANGNTSTLYLGDTNHYLQAVYGTGLKFNTYGTTNGITMAQTSGNVGIGIASAGQKLSVAGTVESTSGGFRFPDGTTQTTAAAGGVTVIDGGIVAQNSSSPAISNPSVIMIGYQDFGGGNDGKGSASFVYKIGATYTADILTQSAGSAEFTVTSTKQCANSGTATPSGQDICVQLSGSSIILSTGGGSQISYVAFR